MVIKRFGRDKEWEMEGTGKGLEGKEGRGGEGDGVPSLASAPRSASVYR